MVLASENAIRHLSPLLKKGSWQFFYPFKQLAYQKEKVKTEELQTASQLQVVTSSSSVSPKYTGEVTRIKPSASESHAVEKPNTSPSVVPTLLGQSSAVAMNSPSFPPLDWLSFLMSRL